MVLEGLLERELRHELACGGKTIPFAVFPYVLQSGRMRLAGTGLLLFIFICLLGLPLFLAPTPVLLPGARFLPIFRPVHFVLSLSLSLGRAGTARGQ